MMADRSKKLELKWSIFSIMIMNFLVGVNGRLGGSNIFIKDNEVTVLDGDYIVILTSTLSNINAMSVDDVSLIADGLGKKYALEKKSLFLDRVHGFAASNVTRRDLANIKKEENVLLIEKDGIISTDPLISESNKFDASESNNTLHDVVNNTSQDMIFGQGEIIPPGVKQVGWRNVENNALIRKKRVYIVDSGLTNSLNEFNIDTSKARNFVSSESPRSWGDCHGHGTHIAGTIAARANGVGVVGVAAGATVVPIRVLDCTNNGKISDVITGINYIAQHAGPGDVVNLSVGGPIPERSLDIALKRAALSTGAKFVVAAGNGSTKAQTYSPARVRARNVYTVCALSSNRREVASFSNIGRPPIKVCAPGLNVLSLSRYGGTELKSGTSMAAPHVSGALIIGPLGTRGKARSNRDTKRYPIVRI